MNDRPSLPVPAGEAPAETSSRPSTTGGDPPQALEARGVRVVDLPSGRSVSLAANASGESLEIRSPGGEMELRIALTPEGPVLSLRGARLELAATESVAVSCKRFELETREGLSLQSGGSLELAAAGDLGVSVAGDVHSRSAGQTWIDGDFVNLNCRDRRGYHDDVTRQEPALEAEGEADP